MCRRRSSEHRQGRGRKTLTSLFELRNPESNEQIFNSAIIETSKESKPPSETSPGFALFAAVVPKPRPGGLRRRLHAGVRDWSLPSEFRQARKSATCEAQHHLPRSRPEREAVSARVILSCRYWVLARTSLKRRKSTMSLTEISLVVFAVCLAISICFSSAFELTSPSQLKVCRTIS